MLFFTFISRDTRRAPDAHTAKQITVDEAGRKSRNNVEMKGTTDPLFRENPKGKNEFFRSLLPPSKVAMLHRSSSSHAKKTEMNGLRVQMMTMF